MLHVPDQGKRVSVLRVLLRRRPRGAPLRNFARARRRVLVRKRPVLQQRVLLRAAPRAQRSRLQRRGASPRACAGNRGADVLFVLQVSRPANGRHHRPKLLFAGPVFGGLRAALHVAPAVQAGLRGDHSGRATGARRAAAEALPGNPRRRRQSQAEPPPAARAPFDSLLRRRGRGGQE